MRPISSSARCPRFGRPLFRLGLSGSFGLDETGCREALERVQYVFWTPRMKGLTPALRDALARDRGRYVVATGPLLGYFPGQLRSDRRGLAAPPRHRLPRRLLFQLFWLGKMSPWTDERAARAREAARRGEGAKAIGVSIHDRPRAGRLAEESALDLLMIRYNAAHPGAEREIFPHLARREPAVVAYTATSWRKLLKRAARLGRPGAVGGRLLPPPASPAPTSTSRSAPRTTAPRSCARTSPPSEKGPLDAGELEGWMRAFGWGEGPG